VYAGADIVERLQSGGWLLGPWSVAGNFCERIYIQSEGNFPQLGQVVGSAIQRPLLGLRTGSGGAFMNS